MATCCATILSTPSEPDFSAKCKDVTELLDELGPRAVRHPLHMRVVYHDSCHLQHAQRCRRSRDFSWPLFPAWS